jgi:hypothetical protein
VESLVNNEEALDKCFEELTSAIQEITVASTPKSRPRADPLPPLPASVKEEIRLKNRLRRQWQVTRDPALKAQVNRLQRSVTYRLNEWKNEHWSDTLESLDSEDQSLWKMTKRVMRYPIPSPGLPIAGRTSILRHRKSGSPSRQLEAQFQPGTTRRIRQLLRWLMRR